MIVLNNYFHDFAISLLFVSAVAAVVVSRYAERDAGAGELFLFVYGPLSKLLAWTLVFIVFAALVRYMSFPRFELADAVRNGQVTPLKVKYFMLAALVLIGLACWVDVSRKVSRLAGGGP